MANNVEKTKKPGTERPDKAAFSLFIGAFFLIVFFVAAYWANIFYKFYQSNDSVLEDWQKNPKNIPDYLPAKDLLYIQSTTVSNARLQAVLCSAGSVIILALAVLLFLRAYKIYQRLKTVEYKETDWRSFNKPAGKIEVLYSRGFNIAAIFFYIFFGGITLLAVSSSFKSGAVRLPGIAIGFFNIILLGVFYYLRNNGEKKSVKSFDASGVLRNDGTYYLWSDFRGVVKRIGSMRYGGRMIYRTELIFANAGVVWIISQRIKNYADVNTFVESLPVALLTD